jgi:hypothetical protein
MAKYTVFLGPFAGIMVVDVCYRALLRASRPLISCLCSTGSFIKVMLTSPRYIIPQADADTGMEWYRTSHFRSLSFGDLTSPITELESCGSPLVFSDAEYARLDSKH